MNNKWWVRDASGLGGQRRAGWLLCGVALMWQGAVPAHAADGPSIEKPRVYADVWQNWQSWSPTTKKFKENMTSWMPKLRFTVLGPVAGGSQLSVDFTKPGGKPWLSFNVPTEEIKAGDWTTAETPRDKSTAGEKKYTNGIGVFGFRIRLKNELTGQNQVLHSGKFKVSKISRFNGTPITKNQNDFYVDHDWALPIGYLYIKPDNVSPSLAVSLWFKGEPFSSDLAGYLFYKGKQIGSTKDQGDTSTHDAEVRTDSGKAGDPHWRLVKIQWYNVADTAKDPETPNEKMHYLDKNPGEYEIKVLRKGKLCRQAKFTVGEDGKIVDNGLVATNKLGTDRMILPVKVIGTTDGAWQKTAWKTDAFYGNPLKGFVAP